MKPDFNIDSDIMFVNMTNAKLLHQSESSEGGEVGEGERRTVEMCADSGRRLLAMARLGDAEEVRACMAGGAPFAADWLGNTPLHAAAAGDHQHVIRVLLRAGALRDARTKTDRTPLHVAAWLGHVGATRALLAGGADVGARDMLRMTPLHWAAQRAHLPVVEALLAAGADPHARNKFRLSARQLAERAQHQQVLQLIDAHDATAAQHDHRTRQQSPAAAEPDEDDPAELLRIPVPSPPPATPAAAAAPAGGDGAGDTLSPESLLQRHGITLLGGDGDGTVLRALSSGRTVVLSDAGKLMLKEASQPPASSAPSSVVVRATPVRGEVKGGAVFTVNARLQPPTARPRPLRRVIHPDQFKLEDLASTGMKTGGRVKIVMNRANFRRLVEGASMGSASMPPGGAADGDTAPPAAADRLTHTDDGTRVSAVEEMQPGDELTATRAELETTRNELETTRHELETTRNELETTRDELETTRQELETTRDELETTRDRLATTTHKLELLEGALSNAGLQLAEWEP